MLHARVVPGHPVLIWIVAVVLLGDVVEKEAVAERLVAVRVPPWDEDGDRIVVPDVDRERFPAPAVEDDDSHHPAHAREEVALASLVVVEAPNHALPREGEVRLADRHRQRRPTHQLHEPAPLVLAALQRQELDPFDHALFTPFARTKSLTS